MAFEVLWSPNIRFYKVLFSFKAVRKTNIY